MSYSNIEQFTAQIQAGNLEKLPDQVFIDLNSATLKDYEALLEIIRYKSFGHRALRIPIDLPELQYIRSLIHSGEFSTALKLLSGLESSAPEVLIEKARCHVFSGFFESVEEMLGPIISDSRVTPATRGVAAQLVGHALLENADLIRSKRYLERALELAHFSGNTLGIISAQLFLSRIYFFDGDFPRAKVTLNTIFEHTEKLGSFRWLLGYYRNLSHCLFFSSDQRCLIAAKIAQEIARALGDVLFLNRGLVESWFMRRHFSLDVIIDPKIVAFASQSKSDLLLWINALKSGHFHNYSLSRFVKMKESSSKINCSLLPPEEPVPVYWIYDRKKECFIDLESATVLKVSTSNPVGKLLEVLNSPQTLLSGEAFEKVWGLKWSPKRHQNVLDVAVHRFNKTLKPLKISRIEGELKINYKGIVF